MNVSRVDSVVGDTGDHFTSVDSPEKFALVRRAAEVFGRTFASRLASNIMDSKDTGCQILYIDEKPRGIVVFDSSVTPRGPARCTENALRIKELMLVDRGEKEGSTIYPKLIEKVIEKAKLLNAQAVYTYSEGDKGKQKVFANNGFSLLRARDNEVDDILIKEIAEPSTSRRKRGFAERGDSTLEVSRKKVELTPVSKHLEATLKNPYVGQIRSGAKTIEGRINSGMFRPVKKGDSIRFFNQSSDVTCLVSRVSRYPSFKAMLEKEGYKKCLPAARSLEQAVGEYDRIPSYPERARKNGVLALELEKK